ncbi:winged helix DNA-binding domain-containing protein, partial [Agrocybe pediades]
IDALIIAAIWGSPNRRLTVREIYDAVREHFPQLDKGNRKWRNGIKYQLSLKAKYVRQKRPDHEPGPGYGQHWLININMGEGYTRKRDR